MPDQEGAPKIIVDTDWKSQAQAEKERLAAAEKAKAPAPKPAGTPGAGPDEGDLGAPPEPNFEELIRMLATQALLYLGAFPDPESGRRMVSLEAAQFNIELLSVLEAKTKGNLTPEEQTFLDRMLHELRMQFVEIGRAVAKAVQEGRIAPQGGPGIATPGGAGVPPQVNIKPPPKG